MKNRSILALAIMILWAGSAADAKYSGGMGTPDEPYRISTPEDLNDIGNHLEDFDKHFILVNDVNLAQYTGTQFNIIGRWIYYGHPDNKPFTGVFDGNDHKIWNFTWRATDVNCIGLFIYVRGGQIKNLGMENVDVNVTTNRDYVGGLVGINCFGTITNCYSTGGVSGYLHVGGLVGLNDAGPITNCYSTGSISGTERVGGLVGYNNNNGNLSACYCSGSISGYYSVGGLAGFNVGTITDCYSTGRVTGNQGVGGLVGRHYGDYSGMIIDCYSTGSITGENDVGGLVGWNSGTITDCYSTGSATGENDVGGLVGLNSSMITDCYSTGSVIGDSALGGLVGNNGGTITNCYSTGSVSEGYVVGGLVGYNYGYGATITNSYSTGSVSGEGDVGGLVGINDGTITNSYSTGSASGIWWVGGLVGVGYEQWVTASFWDVNTSGQSTSAGGTPKTTAEMKTMSTFTDAGWDFVEIWGIGENQTYPFLRNEPAGDLDHDKKVDFADLAILASHWLEGTTP